MRLSVSSLGRIFNRDLPIEFGSESLSSYGGLELLRRYFRLIGLHRRIRRAFGDHDIGGGYKMVFQVETQVDVAATPGPSPVNQASQGNVDNKVLAALGSRNSFLGIAGSFGALKLGKTDAPYKLSTARMDPFSATVGDYNSIMGNTGGDNRTEFDARFPHAVWYESPDVMGVRLNAIWSPGQNRFEDNEGFPIGETVCNGGNSGPCEDGSWGTVYSFAATWENFGFKGVAAYELHKRVNRGGDAGATTPAGVSTVGVADEWAWKFGARYTLAATGTLGRALRDGSGYFAATFPVGDIRPETARLLQVTQEALAAGVAQARAGNHVGDIGHAVQRVAEQAGYSVVRELVGHGIGAAFHEEPQVPNYGKPKRGPRLVPGMTIAIEPMINIGGSGIRTLDDKWTVVTQDGSLSAHFEHTVAITENGPRILTTT